MKKKIFAAVVAAAMVLGLAACGGGSDSKETKAPETKAAETKAAETKAAETKAAETEAPETKAAAGDGEITIGWLQKNQTNAFEIVINRGGEAVLEKAKAACKEAVPEIGVFTGRVVSGDQFISDRDVKERIARQFGGMCTEMEGAAIAQAAYLNGIPFVVIRAISDKADDSATVDYPAFERKAIAHSVALVENLLRRL